MRNNVTRLSVFALALSGCVSARVLDVEGDRLFREGRYTEAAARFREQGLKIGDGTLGDGNDGLLYLMDLGLSLHSAGDYAESNKAFLRAEDIAEIKDYTSLSNEAASLLVGENVRQYQGEDFEKTLITLFIAMNYAAMGDLENARVACRRANSRLWRLKSEGGRDYTENAFAHYLIGVIAQSEGEEDNAAISFRKAIEVEPELERLEKKGNVVVVFQNGIAPIKRPSPVWHELPAFVPRSNPNLGGTVYVNGARHSSTVMAMNIEQWAIKNLDEKYGPLVAKRIAGVVAKEATAYAVEKTTKSELLGALTRIGLYLADQADLRSWQLLPHDLQIARLKLNPGEATIELRGNVVSSFFGNVKQITVPKKGISLVSFRYIP